MTTNSFASSDIGYTLDVLGRRYGVRPSQFLGYHPLDGRGLLLDIKVAMRSAERESKSETVAGQYERKKAGWDKETLREVYGRMM